MTSFRTLCTIFGLLMLEVSQTCSAFEPALLRQGRIHLEQKNRLSSTWGSSRNHPLASHRRQTEFESNNDSKQTGECSNPLSSMIGYYSTLVFASMALLFSTLAPASIAWADEAAAPATTQSTLLQSSPKQNSISVVEEVWNLINKYSMDRSFNGQVGFDCLASVARKI